MLDSPCSLDRSVGVEKNAYVAPDVDGSSVDALSEDNDDWEFERTVALDIVDRDGLKQRFRAMQKSCRVKRQKVPDTVAEAVELADDLPKKSVSPGLK